MAQKKQKINRIKKTAVKKKTVVPLPEDEKQHTGIWSGTISFSLVAIPVRLVRAVEPGRVSFRMLHNTDYSPLQRRMFCPEEGKEVAPEDIVRAFEIAPGSHLIITEEELESVSPDRSRTIEITGFIDISEVAAVFYDHPYYLTPLKGGERSYSLLAEAMRKSGKAGMAKFVLDEREYPVIVRCRDNALELHTLHYESEILAQDAPPKEEPEASEVSRITAAIKKMSSDFKPEKYSDSRREKLMEILRKKTGTSAQVEAPDTGEDSAEGMEDLMEALEKSMRSAKKK